MFVVVVGRTPGRNVKTRRGVSPVRVYECVLGIAHAGLYGVGASASEYTQTQRKQGALLRADSPDRLAEYIKANTQTDVLLILVVWRGEPGDQR